MHKLSKNLLCFGMILGVSMSQGHIVKASETTTSFYKGRVVHSECEEDTIVIPQKQNSATMARTLSTNSSSILSYKANLAVDSGLYAGMTVEATSTSTIKSTGKNMKISSIKTVAKIKRKDNTVTKKSVTKNNVAKCSAKISSSDYVSNISEYVGKHTFTNTGYETKTLTTKKLP